MYVRGANKIYWALNNVDLSGGVEWWGWGDSAGPSVDVVATLMPLIREGVCAAVVGDATVDFWKFPQK